MGEERVRERKRGRSVCLSFSVGCIAVSACVHREEVSFTMAGSLFGRLSLEEGDSANSLEGLDIKLGVEGKHKSPYLLDCMRNSGLREQKWVCKHGILLNLNYSNSTLVCMFMVKGWLVGLDRNCSRCTGSKSQSVMKMSEDRPGPMDVMYRNLRQTAAKKKIRKRDVQNKTARGRQNTTGFYRLNVQGEALFKYKLKSKLRESKIFQEAQPAFVVSTTKPRKCLPTQHGTSKYHTSFS